MKCAVIPAYNEEKSIAGIVSKVRAHVDQVIVVDDGSSDRTAEKAESGGAVVVSHMQNLGVGSSIIDGFEKALDLGAEVVVQIDADGQHRPEEIPLLLKQIESGKADVVVGSRFLRRTRMPVANRIGNTFFTAVTNILTGSRLTDTQSGFRAIRASVLQKVVLQGSFTYVQEFIIRAVKEGFRVVEVPINVQERSHGRSRVVRSISRYGLNALTIILLTIRDYHPFLFFGFVGIILLGIGLPYGFYILAVDWQGGEIGFPRMILVVLLVLSGVQLLFFSLLADMIKRKTKLLDTKIERGLRWYGSR